MSDQEPFNPSIPLNRLPAGWQIDQPYPTSVYLRAPGDSSSHIIIQPWADEAGADQYLVIPMIPSSLPGATATNDMANQELFDYEQNAISYALSLAERI